LDGTWERMHEALRKRVRARMNRDPEPSTGVVDSRSIKTTGVGGDQRGYDGVKKVEGRKRHLLVGTWGLVLQARVHSAEMQDREGIKTLLEPAPDRLPQRLTHVWLDASLHQPGQGCQLGGKDPGLECRDRAPPTEAGPRGGDEEVGERVGRRGDCHGPKEVAVRGGPKAILAKALGGEADLLLVGLEQEAEPRDYERPP
jgi:hypothetical protein